MISLEEVKNAVHAVHYHRFEGTNSCVCALVLTNGHVVVGESHCAVGTEFQPELAMKYSRDAAEAKVLELVAFQQRGMLGGAGQPH